MDLQAESSGPPPCDPQPSGKINKAAFKLFGKRKPRSTVPSIFSVRNKGEAAKGPTKPPLVRSKTHDGLTDTSVMEGGKRETSASGEQLNIAGEGRAASVPRPSVSKSLSFFSLLRRSRKGTAAGPDPPRRKKGLRGLFSSMRLNRREKSAGGAELVPCEVLLASRSSSVEIVKEDITLCLEPQPLFPSTITQEPSEGLTESTELPGDAGDAGSGAASPGDRRSQESQEVVVNGRCDQGDIPVPCSPVPALSPLSQESLMLSPPKASRAASQLRHSGGGASPEARLIPRAPAMTVTPPEPSVSEPSMDRLCSIFTDVTSLKSFDSLTGCGDIIADTEEEGASGSSSGTGSSSGGTGGGTQGAGPMDRPSPIRAPAPSPPISAAPAPLIIRTPAPAPAQVVSKVPTGSMKPQGSGVVAYMGGGEEMASPDEVDDADMQGLWHMLPCKGQDSPALPRMDPVHHAGLPRSQRRGAPPPVKALGLSKIPVGGSGSGSRAGKQHLREGLPEDGRGKDPQDAPANSDEGYWDSTTPGPEEDEGARLLSRDGLPRDSCSGDALYDLYVDPPEGGVASDEEMTLPASSSSSSSSTSGKSKLTPPSQAASFRSLKGSTSLPRDSRIPISVKQTPPAHSASQGALAPTAATATTPTSPTSPTSPTTTVPSVSASKANAQTRTKIPISKVPVRRAGNKPTGARHISGQAPGRAPTRK